MASWSFSFSSEVANKDKEGKLARLSNRLQSFNKGWMRVVVGRVPAIWVHVPEVLEVQFHQARFQLLPIAQVLGKAVSLELKSAT